MPQALRCALLSSFTLDQLPPLVEARLARDLVQARWFIGPFGQYAQLILRDDSELYAFGPQAVFFAVALEDLLSGLSPGSAAVERRAAFAQQRLDEFVGLVRQLAARLPAASIFVHNVMPLWPRPNSLLDQKSPAGPGSIAASANHCLLETSHALSNVFVIDLMQVFRDLAISDAYDPRFYYIARMRLSRPALDRLAEYYHRLLLARSGKRKKCLVVDLDNTLWGGVLGEDGPEHLELGDEGIGRAYRDVQHVLLEWHESGVLLAICSRNDEDLALSVLREHPWMVVRPHHFAAMRINWQDKPSNLRAIAEELNLGLDSMVFVDDSAYEREQVRLTLPEVTVVDMPGDCAYVPTVLAQLAVFDTLRITEEDVKRGQMYVEDRRRRDLEKRALSLRSFLDELNIQVSVQRVDPSSLSRIAQLTQRTNQFNLTTRRYAESDLQTMLQDDAWHVYSIRACDRVGDSGIVGVAIVWWDRMQETGRLDTFLLSCRVLGRGIESASLAGVLIDAARVGMHSIEAEYLPTSRNAIAKGFLENHGFQLGNGVWGRGLTGPESLCPDWINLKLCGGENGRRE